MGSGEILARIIYWSDVSLYWAAPASFLGAILLTPIVWRMGEALLSQYLTRHDHPLTPSKATHQMNLEQSIVPPVPRFCAITGALVSMVAVFIAAVGVSVARGGWFDPAFVFLLSVVDVGDPAREVAWRTALAVAWTLWGLASWAIVLAFSPRPKAMFFAAATLWLAVVYSVKLGVAV